MSARPLVVPKPPTIKLPTVTGFGRTTLSDVAEASGASARCIGVHMARLTGARPKHTPHDVLVLDPKVSWFELPATDAILLKVHKMLAPSVIPVFHPEPAVIAP